MLRRYAFRPAWVLTVGPGLVLAVALSALIVKAGTSDLLSGQVVLRLLIIPGVVLVYAHVRWLLKGCMVIDANQVVFRGWVKRTDREGVQKTVYLQQYVPREKWNAITVEGLFFPRVIWSRFGETLVFERVSRPRMLRQLLSAPPAEFDGALPLRPSLLLLVGLVELLRLLANALIASTIWLARWAWPHLQVAAQWSLGRLRRVAGAVWRRLSMPAGVVPSPAPPYAQFVAFCEDHLFNGATADAGGAPVNFYLEVLERAHILRRRMNGHRAWTPHPRIHSIDDVTRRIPPPAFEQMWLENLLSDTDWGQNAPGGQVPVPAAAN